MEKLLKEDILKIAEGIFLNSDIIAKHGTSIENALSIIDTGFNYDKTSMVSQESKDPVILCSYGWKENKRGDLTNVILSIPKSFIKKLNGFDDTQYEVWLSNIAAKGMDAEALLYAVSEKVENESTSFRGIMLPKVEKCHIPREFVKGCFVFCDNTSYLDFLSNPEEALNHLSYIENENYYDNLSIEEQDKFIEEFNSKNEEKKSVRR